jgi:hypothetical protein
LDARLKTLPYKKENIVATSKEVKTRIHKSERIFEEDSGSKRTFLANEDDFTII